MLRKTALLKYYSSRITMQVRRNPRTCEWI